MVKLDTQSVPSEFETLYGQSLVNRDIRGIDDAGRKVFQDSRKILGQLEEKSLIFSAADAWTVMDGAQKTAWNNAMWARVGEARGYELFVEDFCYRQQVGKSPTDQIASFHQLSALRISAPVGEAGIKFFRRFWGGIGPFLLQFCYKQEKISGANPPNFQVYILELYWVGASLTSEVTTFTTTADDVAWNVKSIPFGQAGRNTYYFQIQFQVINPVANVWLDNITLQNYYSYEFFRESFELARVGIGMTYAQRRPYNWQFYSGYGYEPWRFNVEYTEARADNNYLDP